MNKELTPLEALKRIKYAPTIYVGCYSDIYTRHYFEYKLIETAIKALEIVKENVFLDDEGNIMPMNREKSQEEIELLKKVLLCIAISV